MASAGGRRGRRPCISLGVPSSPLLPQGAGYRVKRDLLQPCNVCMGSSARHILLSVGAGAGRVSTAYLDARRVSCVRHYQVLSIAFRPLHFVRGVNRKAALVSHAFLASSYNVVVHERWSGFSDTVDAVGMGSSSTSICPVRCSLQTTVALALNPSVPSRVGWAHAMPVSMRNATWLILPVVICLSQRLSHACGQSGAFVLHSQRRNYWIYEIRTTAKAFSKDVFINQERKLGARRQSATVLVSTINDADQGSADVAFRTLPAPYEKSKFLGFRGSMVAKLKLKGIDGRAPPGVEPAA
ncbi:putative domain-containing protein-like [Capsicum annuum]|nr:putative domain-containing protein-like [Capsicum annuum]